MILSALLVSVALNLSLCLVFFTLFSIWRKQPGNADVYAPRLVAEGKSPESGDFNLKRLLPSTMWLRNVWETSEEDLLTSSGLDAFVFMRIYIFSLNIFTFAGIVGLFVLLPINYLGNLLDIYDLQNRSVDTFSISNVNDGSKRLWVHFCAVYVFTALVCYLLYFEYNYISSKRISCFYSSKLQPHQFTVLVRSVPKSHGKSFSESVEKFFKEFYPSEYLSHSVVHRAIKLKRLISTADKLYRLVHLLKKHGSQRFGRTGFLGLFGRRVDLLEHYGKELENVEDQVRMLQSLRSEKEVSAAFVSFKTRFSAAVALHIQQGENPTEWFTEPAPEPQDVHRPFFFASITRKWIDNVVVIIAFILFTLLFLIPVAIVQGLTHLDQLEIWFPFLKDILRKQFVSRVITGFFPSLILQLCLSIVPTVMLMLSTVQGYIANSQIERSACIKILYFTIWNIFFASVISGSALYRVNIFRVPEEIPRVLAVAVPGQASFFIAYVVSSWTSTCSELFRLFPLVGNYLERTFCWGTGNHLEVYSIPYHSEIPKLLFFGLLGITYFILAPLILPFLLVYYCLGYITFRHQLLNVYSPKFDTGGTFWPIVHNSTIFSLILMHIIAAGMFELKALPLASLLIVPLPLITLLFNSYCRKRFLPVFKAYSAECLIKKDRNDVNDPMMADFRKKLVTAYQDPAMATRVSTSIDSLKSPLLHAAEV